VRKLFRIYLLSPPQKRGGEPPPPHQLFNSDCFKQIGVGVRECERGCNSERAFVRANKTGEVYITMLCKPRRASRRGEASLKPVGLKVFNPPGFMAD